MLKRNWREQTPHAGHESAIAWMLMTADYDESWQGEPSVLRAIEAIAKQAVQGRKQSDYHAHEDMEQLYYILSGSGVLRIDDVERQTKEGDAIYLPPDVKHQFINNTEDWAEFLVISCIVEGNSASEAVVRNWREQSPFVGHDNAIIWALFRSQEDACKHGEVPCLQRLSGFTRHAMQGGKTSDYHVHRDLEQIYYMLNGQVTLRVNDERYALVEGDIVQLLPGDWHQVINEGDDWATYLIFHAQIREENRR
jgi:quercetin dioxygenase-like cupin family protein